MSEIYDNTVIEEMRQGVQSVLDQWGLPLDSEVSLLNVSENATFVAVPSNGGEKVIVRVHRPDYHTRQEIESELMWLDSLRAQGAVSTAATLPIRSGGKIAVLSNNGADRLAVGFEFLSGREPEPGKDLTRDFFTLGAITAKLHKHAKSWAVPGGFKRKIWDFNSMLGARPLWGDFRNAIGLSEPGRLILEQTAARLEKQLKAYGQAKDRFGLIHADLRLANLLIDESALSVIDFDDCGYSWFMYDFAAAVSFMEEDIELPALQTSWVNGYRSVAPLTREDEGAIPMFIILRRILLTAWIASHSETDTAREMGDGFTQGTIRLAQAYLQS